MDTSETCVKMCEKAKEIQEDHNWVEGDYGWDGMSNTGEYILVTDSKLTRWEREDEGYPMHCIWLPRQDQLQEMVEDKDNSLRLIWRFYDWLTEDYKGKLEPIQYDSMEQLWLAFVMKEKYNKIWDGENWV